MTDDLTVFGLGRRFNLHEVTADRDNTRNVAIKLIGRSMLGVRDGG